MNIPEADILHGFGTLAFAILAAGGSLIGWLLHRAISGVDSKLTGIDEKLDDLSHTQTHHGERLVRLETMANLDPLPAPPPRLRKAK